MLNFLLWLDTLKPQRGDDEFTAAWKAKQREILMSSVWMVVAVVMAFLIANVLDAFASIPLLGAAIDGSLRQPAGYVVLGALGLFFLRMCFAWWDLLRFMKKNGAE